MLAAYFDDTGTHDGATLLGFAAVVGTTKQWEPFETAWAEMLRAPVPGRGPIKKFRMSSCEAAEDDFVGWSRAERDLAIYEFRKIIIESGIVGHAGVISKPDWDRFIKPEFQLYLGDAEGVCINNCILGILHAAQLFYDEAELALFFDNRPHREQTNQRIFSVYQLASHIAFGRPRIVSMTSVAVEDFLPLQAADMVAWECRHYAEESLRSPTNVPEWRPHFEALVETGRFSAQICAASEAEGIAKTLERMTPEELAFVKSEGPLRRFNNE